MKLARISVIVILAAAVSLAHAEDMKKHLQTMVNGYCQTVLKKDAAQITAYLREHFSSDFHFVPLKGKTMNLDQWISQEVSQTSMSEKVTRMEIIVSKASSKGDTATGMTTIHFAALVKMDPKAKAGKLTFDGTSSMKLVKTGGSWHVLEIKEIQSTLLINGKPMKM